MKPGNFLVLTAFLLPAGYFAGRHNAVRVPADLRDAVGEGAFGELGDMAAIPGEAAPAPQPERTGAARTPLLLGYRKLPVSYRLTPDGRDTGAQKLEYSWVSEGTPPSESKGTMQLYLPPAGAPRGRFVLVFPITGDARSLVSRNACRSLLDKGYRCAYFIRPSVNYSLPSSAFSKQPGIPPNSVVSARRGLDALRESGILLPDEPIGVAGFSLGAIEAALLSLSDPQVGAAAVILGGANLAMIFSEIKGFGVQGYVSFRESEMRRNGWTLEEFRRETEKATHDAEPLTYIKALQKDQGLAADRYLLVTSKGDQAIPNASSRELYDALSGRGTARPKAIRLRFPLLPESWHHVGTLLQLDYINGEIAAHFDKFLIPRP